MTNWITRPHEVKTTTWRLFYEHLCHMGSGYSFDCDSDGKVFEAELTDVAANNLAYCRENTGSTGALFHMPVVERRLHLYWNPGSIRCRCGAEHFLSRYDSGCESCGQLFNAYGQELLPQSQWEES